MYLVSQLIDDTLADLHGTYAAKLNRLNGAVNAAATTLTFEFTLDGMFPGALLETPAGELVYVWSINAGAKTAVVERGYRGTLAGPISDDAIIEVGPRFGRERVRLALWDELRALPTTLFREHVAAPSSLLAGARTLTLDVDDAIRVLEVRRDHNTLGPSQRNNTPAIGGAEIERAGPLATAGTLVAVPAPFGFTTDVYAVVARPFDLELFDDAVDLIGGVGLATTMLDIPRWGAIGTLLGKGEALRADLRAANQQRDAEQVPPTHHTQAATWHLRQRDVRIRQEADRLRARWPVRSAV